MNQFRMLDRKVDKPTCIEIKVEHVDDSDPDLSWLDQSDAEMGEGFEAKSAERKATYGETWSTIGIQAAAVYLIPVDSGSSIQTVVSGGLWGVETDSDAAYIAEIEEQELAEVRELMDKLGIVHEGVEPER